MAGFPILIKAAWQYYIDIYLNSESKLHKIGTGKLYWPEDASISIPKPHICTKAETSVEFVPGI